MGIVNAGQLDVYDTIDPELREACEDVILNRRADATERLLDLAERYKGDGRARRKGQGKDLEWRGWPVASGSSTRWSTASPSSSRDTEEARLQAERR
jgi:5-methyltetrahydrofolate--homocysteine methyltransferase